MLDASIDKIIHFGYTRKVESLGAPLTQRLGTFNGEWILTFILFAAAHTLPDGRQDRLDRPLEQG